MPAAVLGALLAAPATAVAGASVGSLSVFASTDGSRPGRAEGFRSLATASGRVDRLSAHLAGSNTATRIELGLYRNRANKPSSRIGRCVLASPRARAWNSCAIKPAKVRAGIAYWVTILQPLRAEGRLRFRATHSARRMAMRSYRTRMKRLPRSWSRARVLMRRGRASLFADSEESPGRLTPPVIDPPAHAPSPPLPPTLPGPTPPPNPELPPLGQPSCVAGATTATTAAQARSAVQAGQDACVTAAVGNVDLDGLTSSTVRHIGTSGSGSMGAISLSNGSRITLRARFRSITVSGSNSITIEQSKIGGTEAGRTLDILIYIPEGSDDVTIRDNDIGWTSADNSNNTGYGVRAFNDLARLRIERNYIHHIGADALQLGLDGADTVVDRNEVAYAARPASSNEHSDDLQIIGNGPNMRVTNNYFHHCGWFTATGPSTGCNSMALHAGTSNSLLFENNVEAHALGLPFVGDLGTGGCVRSNATFRNNTWWDNGTQFADKPDLQFGLCGGSNNLWERNLVVSKMNFSGGAGFAQSGTTARDNLVGNHAMSADGQCTAAACTTTGGAPIGYRKPTGVHW